jgi:hypothetical protein
VRCWRRDAERGIGAQVPVVEVRNWRPELFDVIESGAVKIEINQSY